MSMFKPIVHVLGSGTCHPVPGGKRRAHPGFFIRWGEGDQHLLLECSENMAVRIEAIGEEVDRIRHLAISHAHPDHFALPQFVQSMNCAASWRPKAGLFVPGQLHVYGSAHVVQSVSKLNHIHFEETVSERGAGLSNPDLALHMMLQSTVEFGEGVKLSSFPVHHGFGKVEALAFRLELPGLSFAYSGDTGMCDGLIKAAQGVDLFICEASAPLGNEAMATGYGHLNPRQAGEVAKTCGVKKLVLTHYSGRDSDEAMLADCRLSGFEGEIVIAKDGDMYLFN